MQSFPSPLGIMFIPLTTLLTCLALRAAAEPAVPKTEYYEDLVGKLNDAGLQLFRNALEVANTTGGGKDLLDGFYSDRKFTLYAPVDSVSLRSLLGAQNAR